jgi:hypothetical protein
VVDGWSPDDTETIPVGDRRMRVRRRRQGRFRPIVALAAVALLIAVGLGVYFWLKRPTGLAALPGPAVVAAGAFQAKVGADHTITVALEIRNTTDVPVTVTRARIVAPAGLTQVALSLLPPGEQNKNLALGGDLPPAAPVDLGTNGVDRNAIVAARFSVDCTRLPASDGPTGEQIFVTVRVGTEQREEELTSPVVGDVPWLTATARSACVQPTVSGTFPSPLPPLPTSDAG